MVMPYSFEVQQHEKRRKKRMRLREQTGEEDPDY